MNIQPYFGEEFTVVSRDISDADKKGNLIAHRHAFNHLGLVLFSDAVIHIEGQEPLEVSEGQIFEVPKNKIHHVQLLKRTGVSMCIIPLSRAEVAANTVY